MNKQVPEHPAIKNRETLNPLVVVAALMVTSYLTANVMAVKLITVFGMTLFDAGTITFPLAYVLGDVLTEIWGLNTAKKVIWLTFVCNGIFLVATYIGVLLPYPDYVADTASAYATVFAYVPRIVLASVVAFLCGELVNAYAMEKIKLWSGNRFLWMRTIGSSMVGYIFDTGLFVLIAFAGTAPAKDLFQMILAQYLIKVAIEALCGTPLAYAVIARLRKRVVVQ
jgi:uncharacterized integral membrane protein (TIGR00697 family)